MACVPSASARHLSFKRAADEPCVTPGAVSQQVKSLEASMKLSRRLPRGLLLTAVGKDYLHSISRAFRAISDATEIVTPALKGRGLRFAISPALRREEHPAIGHLKRHQPLAKLVFTDDLSQFARRKSRRVAPSLSAVTAGPACRSHRLANYLRCASANHARYSPRPSRMQRAPSAREIPEERVTAPPLDLTMTANGY